MGVRKTSFLLVSVLLLTTVFLGQEREASQVEKRHFLMSLVINGHYVTQYDLRFLVRGREIVPERDNDRFLVPDEVLRASWQESGVRFVGTDFDFTFENLLLKGYGDSDGVKSDYTMRIEDDPLLIKQHISNLTKKERYSLGIRTYKNVCLVFTLEPSNLVVNNPDLIVDPVTTRGYRFCKALKH